MGRRSAAVYRRSISAQAAQHVMGGPGVNEALGGGRTLLAPRGRSTGNLPSADAGIIELTGVADALDEEVFGPPLSVWRYAHFDEAIRSGE